MTGPGSDAPAPRRRWRDPIAGPVLLFFVSGACALVYQVVWVRRLLLLTGTTTAAVSTVLGVFMAGLGLGAWFFGARADRSRSPLKMYGYLEAGIALYALLLPFLISVSTPLYVDVARAFAGRPAALLILRVGVGFFLLIAPTVLMGGTLPVLVRHVGRHPGRFGTDLGVLYTANLAGGVAGSLAAGFVLIRWLGVEGATRVAVLANLAVAVAALVWADRAKAGVAPLADARPAALRLAIPAGTRPLVWAAVIFSGVLTMAYEVLWTRILVFPFKSTVYAFTLILATFLAALALGSRLYVAVERRPDALRALAVAQVLAGLTALLFTPLSVLLVDVMRSALTWVSPGPVAYLFATALSAALVMLVPATFMGLVLPLGMRLLVSDLSRSGRQVGAAYLWNTVGSVAGSLLTGFVLIPLLGLKGVLLVLASVQVALGCAFLVRAEVPARRRRQLVALSVSLLLAAIAGASLALHGPSPFDRQNLTGPGPAPTILAHRDAVGASISVVSSPQGDNMLRIDGFNTALEGSSGAYMPMMTHIPMLLHPDPRRLLVICFGTGSTAGAGLLHPETRIDVVDINRTVFEFAPHFETWNHGVARDPRVRLIVDDGRNFLLTSRERYDVITSEPMPPRFAGVVNLYSREYYRLAYERLRPGGLVVQWLPLHLVDADEALRILRTVSEVFPESTLWMHDFTGIIVARRDAAITLDLARVRRALESPALRDDLGRFGVRQPLDLARLHALGPETIRRAVARIPAITDDRPALEFHPPTSPMKEMGQLPDVGLVFSRAMSRSLEVVHRLRLDDVVPFAGASVTEEAATGRARKAESHATLGHLYVVWGQHGAAVAELERAARTSDDPRSRAALLVDAAKAAAREGRFDEARRLADESLAAVPAYPDALAFRAALGATAR